MQKTKQDEFLKLYEPVHERFERFCRARVYGDMEYRDLINETLLVAYNKFESLKSKDAFLSYLFSTAIRILGTKNQKIKEGRYSELHEINGITDQNADSQRDVNVHFLYEALSKLNENQRESIILFEISGFSIKEIAEIQHSSQDAVKQRLKRGREKLAQILTFESVHKTGHNYEE